MGRTACKEPQRLYKGAIYTLLLPSSKTFVRAVLHIDVEFKVKLLFFFFSAHMAAVFQRAES